MIVRFLQDRANARATLAGVSLRREQALTALSIRLSGMPKRDAIRGGRKRFRSGNSAAQRRYAALLTRYPLLVCDDKVNKWGLAALHFEEGREAWLSYVDLIDNCKKGA